MPLSSFTEVNIQEIKIMASSPITSWKIKGEKVEVVTNFIFLGSRITVDSDCSHEIKRCLLIGRKTMTNLDSKFKCQDITLPTEVPLVKAMVFPDVMCGCEISSVTQLCPTLCDSMDCTCQASLSINNSRSLWKLMSIDWVKPSNHFILCCLLLLLPSIFLSIRVFSNKSALRIRWPKYWSFNLASVLPMNIQDWFPLGWTGLISFQSKGLSRVYSNTAVQKHQLFGAQLSL